MTKRVQEFFHQEAADPPLRSIGLFAMFLAYSRGHSNPPLPVSQILTRLADYVLVSVVLILGSSAEFVGEKGA